MSEIFTVVIFTGVSVCILTLLFIYRKAHHFNLPPGPKGYPFIGNILQVNLKNFRNVLLEFREIYGDIYTLRLLGTVFIVCSEYGVLNDLLVKHSKAFRVRPPQQIWDAGVPGHGEGIITAQSCKWQHNRKLCLKIMKDHGVGKNRIEMKIHEEIRCLNDAIERLQGREFDPTHLLVAAVSNIMASIVLGKSFDYSDVEYENFLKLIEEMAQIPVFFKQPWFGLIPGDPFDVNKHIHLHRQLSKFYAKKINEHFGDFDENHIKDIIDTYIQHVKAADEVRDSESLTIDDLLRVTDDLFIAGTETSAAALRWGVVQLLRDSRLQARIQEEIDANIPRERLPAVSDKPKLPYLHATVLELLRFSHVIPGYTRLATEDFKYRGYTIPKGSIVYVCVEAVSVDKNVWRNPHMFDPSRFLNANMKDAADRMLPFGLGKRACLGEGLAKTEIYLFLAALLQRFKFLPSQEGPPSMDCNSGLTSTPKPFKVRAILRD